MEDCTHKTVFVIDHSPYFGISSDDPMEFEHSKIRNFVPLNPITKSLWTCSIEAAVEYCRIVWDLFPARKLVLFIASDKRSHHFNTWQPSQQNIHTILEGSMNLGAPDPPNNMSDYNYSVLHGLRAALEVLTDKTELQMKAARAPNHKIENKCRIICITSTSNDAGMHNLQECFFKNLMAQNKQVAGSDSQVPISFCHLVVVNIFPNSAKSMVSDQPPQDINNLLRTEVHSVCAGKHLSDKLTDLILGHYDLASTTVTGIPMKEEQNSSSSANYDVEIFHQANAHTEMFKADMLDALMVKARKTMTLKWCTPRGNAQEMYNCSAVYRVTPVDVNSRPSSCLINFLLGGRSVLLEMPRRSGGKTNSHLLSAHGGEIFIHALSTGRSVLEDPPAISEGCGGRVTDYRVADFGAFIRANKVVPLRSCIQGELSAQNTPFSKMLNRLERQTRYWPITFSSTFIFNLHQVINPLPTLIIKDELTAEDVVLCRQVIYNLVGLEAKNETLIQQTSGVRGKVPKKEEQYKQMWNELEKLVRLHCRTDNHKQVLYSLLELRSKDPEKGDLEKREPLVEPANRTSVIRPTIDSPMSPPPSSKAATTAIKPTSGRHNTIYSASRTVFDMYLNKLNNENKNKRRPDFYGRLNGENKAILYAKKNKESDISSDIMIE